MKPPAGHYRKILGDKYPSVKFAYTHIPIIGCKRVDYRDILEILDNSTDVFAKFYSDGLRNGTIAAIEEIQVEKVWKPGELFFTT